MEYCATPPRRGCGVAPGAAAAGVATTAVGAELPTVGAGAGGATVAPGAAGAGLHAARSAAPLDKPIRRKAVRRFTIFRIQRLLDEGRRLRGARPPDSS